LREVALPVPATVPGDPVTLITVSGLAATRPPRPCRHLPGGFQSHLAQSLKRYVAIKRAMGSDWRSKTAVLADWDAFVHRKYPKARRVTPAMFAGWTSELARMTSTGSLAYQRIVRNFLLFQADIEDEQTVLRIRLTKFYKSRLVPLSPTVTLELRHYLQKRGRRKLPIGPEAFLMWSGHGGSEVYGTTNFATVWRQLCLSARVLNPQGHPPRLHDLRHSAAVNVLQRWYAQGADVQTKLPHLAAYLGHVNAVSTHHYLKLTPELRQAASQRFHQRLGASLSLGGVA